MFSALQQRNGATAWLDRGPPVLSPPLCMKDLVSDRLHACYPGDTADRDRVGSGIDKTSGLKHSNLTYRHCITTKDGNIVRQRDIGQMSLGKETAVYLYGLVADSNSIQPCNAPPLKPNLGTCGCDGEWRAPPAWRLEAIAFSHSLPCGALVVSIRDICALVYGGTRKRTTTHEIKLLQWAFRSALSVPRPALRRCSAYWP